MDKLALILPHKDREIYKEFQRTYFPAYLHRQNIDYKVILCEQKNLNTFNRAKTINMAFKFASEKYKPDYIVVGDIDLVPLNIDYRYRGIAEVWFGNAGGLKISSKAFTKANGFNNNFVGWGYEDSEFWRRLQVLDIEVEVWKERLLYPAEMVDLEMHNLDSRGHSFSYFGMDNPRMFHPSEKEITKHIRTLYPKTWLTDEGKANNAAFCNSIQAMPKEEAINYFKVNGLNEIKLSDVQFVSDINNLVEVFWE